MCYGIAVLLILMLLGSAGLVFSAPVPQDDAVERRAQVTVALLILLVAVATVMIMIAAAQPPQ